MAKQRKSSATSSANSVKVRRVRVPKGRAPSVVDAEFRVLSPDPQESRALAAVPAVDESRCPLCGEGGANEEIRVGPVSMRACAHCVGAVFGGLRLFKKWVK
jgi:hypothetical protein